MLLDRMGYILSELFTLLLVIVFVKGVLRLRRGGANASFFRAADRQLLLQPIRLTVGAPQRMIRYTLITTLGLLVGGVEFFMLAQFGATILTGVLVVSCGAIVHRALVQA